MKYLLTGIIVLIIAIFSAFEIWRVVRPVRVSSVVVAKTGATCSITFAAQNKLNGSVRAKFRLEVYHFTKEATHDFDNPIGVLSFEQEFRAGESVHITKEISVREELSCDGGHVGVTTL